MRSGEEIRVRVSCYDNEQYVNSKYTHTWDHLLCQKATLFRELRINSIVSSISRSYVSPVGPSCLLLGMSVVALPGITKASYFVCFVVSDMFKEAVPCRNVIYE